MATSVESWTYAVLVLPSLTRTKRSILAKTNMERWMDNGIYLLCFLCYCYSPYSFCQGMRGAHNLSCYEVVIYSPSCGLATVSPI